MNINQRIEEIIEEYGSVDAYYNRNKKFSCIDKLENNYTDLVFEHNAVLELLNTLKSFLENASYDNKQDDHTSKNYIQQINKYINE